MSGNGVFQRTASSVVPAVRVDSEAVTYTLKGEVGRNASLNPVSSGPTSPGNPEPGSSTCTWCGKTLTDPDSVRRGLGPDCFSYLQGVKGKLGAMTGGNRDYWLGIFARLSRKGVRLEE